MGKGAIQDAPSSAALETLVNRCPSPEHDAQARIPFPPGIEKTAVESRPL
jgi:hypothetical protein